MKAMHYLSNRLLIVLDGISESELKYYTEYYEIKNMVLYHVNEFTNQNIKFSIVLCSVYVASQCTVLCAVSEKNISQASKAIRDMYPKLADFGLLR